MLQDGRVEEVEFLAEPLKADDHVRVEPLEKRAGIGDREGRLTVGRDEEPRVRFRSPSHAEPEPAADMAAAQRTMAAAQRTMAAAQRTEVSVDQPQDIGVVTLDCDADAER